MDMPKPASEHRELERLAGTWEGGEIMHPSPWMPQGGKAVGHVKNRIGLNGFALVQEYEQRMGETSLFKGHGVFTVDPATREYLLTWFDSSGAGPNAYRGQLKAGVLSLVSHTPQGQMRAVFDLREEGRYRFLMEASGDGREWQPMMEGTYTRIATA